MSNGCTCKVVNHPPKDQRRALEGRMAALPHLIKSAKNYEEERQLKTEHAILWARLYTECQTRKS